MTPTELKTYSASDLRDLDMLMHELSPNSSCTEERLRKVLADDNSYLYIIREVGGEKSGAYEGQRCENISGGQSADGHIVACACMCVMHTVEFTLASIEAVVVASSCRGKGYGRQLMEHAIAEARKLNVDSVHLTSNPKRVAANALYQSLGFERYETNVYHLDL